MKKLNNKKLEQLRKEWLLKKYKQITEDKQELYYLLTNTL